MKKVKKAEKQIASEANQSYAKKTTRRKGRGDKAIWVELEQRRRQHTSNDTERNSTVHQERYPWKTCESLRSPPAGICTNPDRKNPIPVASNCLGRTPAKCLAAQVVKVRAKPHTSQYREA